MIFKNLKLKNQTTNKYQLLTKIMIKFNKLQIIIQIKTIIKLMKINKNYQWCKEKDQWLLKIILI